MSWGVVVYRGWGVTIQHCCIGGHGGQVIYAPYCPACFEYIPDSLFYLYLSHTTMKEACFGTLDHESRCHGVIWVES